MKVKLKPEILEQMRKSPRYHSFGTPAAFIEVTLDGATSNYSREFDIPFIIVNDKEKKTRSGQRFYVIESPTEIANCIILFEHMEYYEEPFQFTIDDEVFE